MLTALALLAGVAAGCGSGSGGANGASNGAGGASPAQTADAPKSPADYKGTISVWSWDATYFKNLAEAFNKVYPNVKVEFTNVPSADYQQKIQTTLASGGELPDIMAAEISFRGKAFEYDIWENLEQPPYNFDRKLVFDYTIPLTSNAKGQIVAVENAVNAAGLAYRRDLTKQYLGTDDPKALEAMFPTLDAMIDKGKEIVAKSGGKVHPFAGLGDAFAILDGQNKTPLLENGTLQITKRFKDTLNTVAKVRDSGIADKLTSYSPQWNASYASGAYMFYPAATWSIRYSIKSNDPQGEGKWGLMLPPGGPFSMGGTALGISKTSKNKELAWKFIQWSLLTKEGLKTYKDLNKASFSAVNFKDAYSDPDFASQPDSYFGGQDIGKFWMEEAVPKIQMPTLTPYDKVIKETNAFIMNLMISDPSVDGAKALELYIKEIKNKLPDVQVS